MIAQILLAAGLAHAAPLIQIDTGTHEPVVSLKDRKDIAMLASAGSTFKDDVGGKSATVQTIGSATLVKIKKNNHVAVLTAAHVVGGEKPWVEIGTKRLTPKSVYIDNDRDIAVLDLGVRKNTDTALVFDDKLVVTPKFMKEIESDQVPLAMIAYYFPGHALGFALRPWVDPGVESAYTRSVVHAPIVSMTENGDMIRVFTKITSGASGSAVLDLREKSVAGLVVQSHYYFSETYLVAPQILKQHFDKFVAGSRGLASGTVWKMKNHLTYRVFGDGTEEASFATHPTGGVIGQPGNGVLGQPGNGVLGQPGNGVLGQPGNGVLGQPGNGVLGQPGNGVLGQPGSGVIGQPGAGAAQFQPWSEDPRSVFDYFDLKPGLLYQGQSIIGLKVKSKTPTQEWPAQFMMLAEPEAIAFLESHKNDFTAEPVKTDANFADLLRERAGTDKRAITLKAVYGPSAIANDFELKPATANELKVEITSKDEIKVHVKTYSKMDRQTWQLVPDEIEFTLNAKGATDGGKQFLPVIATKGLKSGETYYVDLRQFFFTDYSQLARPVSDWSKENPPFDPQRFDLAKQIQTIGFAVRNANSGAEFTYGFAK